jgi:hypothetical protein
MFSKLRRIRKMTYVLWAWCLAIIVWASSAAGSAGDQVGNCVKGAAGVLTRTDCSNAAAAGGGIAVLVILFIGFVGFVFFALIWFMSRPRTAAPAA